MKPQRIGTIFKGKTHTADTIVDWDEFAKLVNVGEIVKTLTGDLIVTQKEFEETSDALKINIYANPL